MSRPLRVEFPGAIYHVGTRGNVRRSVFRDDVDRSAFIALLAKVVVRFGWECFAYCLMTNHYHLLVRTPEPNLSRGMRQLNGVYAQAFNRRWSETGHLWEGPYDARVVQHDHHLMSSACYVVMNPVRAGICASPEDWPWSSHRAIMGSDRNPIVAVDALLAYFGGSKRSALRVYRDLLGTTGYEPPPDVAIDGDRAFVSDLLGPARPSPEIPVRRWRNGRPPLAEILSSNELGNALITATHRYGYTLAEIAAETGRHYSTISRWLKTAEAECGISRPDPVGG